MHNTKLYWFQVVYLQCMGFAKDVTQQGLMGRALALMPLTPYTW